MEDAVIPLPRPEMTPPVTKMYFMPSRELSITWNDIYDLCSAILDYNSVEQKPIKNNA
jgi:hypothetical protein